MQFSIINKSEIFQHKDKRIDADFYRSDFIQNDEILSSVSKVLGNYLLKITGGATPLGASYLENGIPFLRVHNIMQNYIQNIYLVYISEKDDNNLKRSKLSEGDVLLTITGSYGKSATVIKEYEGANINQHSVRMKFIQGVNPFYVSTFLNCRYGKTQSDRNIVGISRPALDYSAIKNFWLPIFSLPFQNAVGNIVKFSYRNYKIFLGKYSEAENLLLSTLHLSSWKPKQTLFYIKNYSDIKLARRIDADYFQPKYGEIINAIKKHKNGWEFLSSITSINNKKILPDKNKTYKYLEIADIGTSGNILGCTEATGENLPTRARRKVLTNDVIVSSVEGSLESVALIPEKYNNALCSTGFHVLRSSALSPECLFVFMKSILGQLLLKRGCKGTILTAIGQDEISQLPLPLLETKIQKKINNKIFQSMLAQQHSKNLLQTAKRAVEIAIEKGETKAKAWLEKQE